MMDVVFHGIRYIYFHLCIIICTELIFIFYFLSSFCACLYYTWVGNQGFSNARSNLTVVLVFTGLFWPHAATRKSVFNQIWMMSLFFLSCKIPSLYINAYGTPRSDIALWNRINSVLN